MFAYIPVWVPLVLLLLLVLGQRQSRTRDVRPGLVTGIALAMFAFSLFGVVSAFGAAPAVLLLWAAAYASSVFWGARRVSSRGMALVGAAVRVPGSWVPLALMLGIFGAKFLLGFAAGVHAGFLHELWFVAAMSAVLGLLSGGFGARAVAVRRFAAAGSRHTLNPGGPR
ncbi:MAG: hypothetical protein IV093_11165 [Rubrivivax sp.]|nr:hypothetical protein [Rubrivivax sp.]